MLGRPVPGTQGVPGTLSPRTGAPSMISNFVIVSLSLYRSEPGCTSYRTNIILWAQDSKSTTGPLID